MKKRKLSLFLALILLLCCGCGGKAAPVLYTSAAPCEEPSGEGYSVAMSFYHEGDEPYQLDWDWSIAFEGVSPRDVDRCANPPRFDGDKSVWMTYDRNGDWDDCVLGRCITTQEEWDFMDRVLFSPEYEADPDAQPFMQTPRFILRQGNECTSSAIRAAAEGQTYYIDDTVSQYFVSPDGSVIRIDADESVYRAKKQLDRETVAFLYLLYEGYYNTAVIMVPWAPSIGESADECRLLVDCDGQRVALPGEAFDAFLALITEDGNTSEDGNPCYNCTMQIFCDSDYPSPEVLRFRFVREGDDPDQNPFLWFSLRKDGKVIMDRMIGAGYIYNDAWWSASGRNRAISVSTFPVKEITAFVAANGEKIQ